MRYDSRFEAGAVRQAPSSGTCLSLAVPPLLSAPPGLIFDARNPIRLPGLAGWLPENRWMRGVVSR